MQPFNDLVLSNWNWEDFKIEHTIKDLKNRTDVLKTEADSLEKIINTLGSDSSVLSANISILTQKLFDMQTVMNAILLKETSIITEEELKNIYKMLCSPDKENKLVAEEAIINKLKELK